MLGGFIQQAFDWLDGVDKEKSFAEVTSEPLRQVILGQQSVPYRLTRAKRKTIAMLVSEKGLAVRAPRWTPLYEIESVLRGKSDWILKKLFEAKQRQCHSHTAPTSWQEGGQFSYLGEPLKLRLAALQTCIDTDRKCIWLALPVSATEKQIEDSVVACVQKAAARLFESRLHFFAPQLGVNWRSLKLSSAQGRWGSAKSDGSIRLNWRLMHFRLPVIDYVVVHELSHLRHMNHSPQFWETVHSIMPDYAKRKTELNGRLIKT